MYGNELFNNKSKGTHVWNNCHNLHRGILADDLLGQDCSTCSVSSHLQNIEIKRNTCMGGGGEEADSRWYRYILDLLQTIFALNRETLLRGSMIAPI